MKIIERPGKVHRDYNLEARNSDVMAKRIAEWNTLAWAAENAKTEGRAEDYKLSCMLLGINCFYEGSFDSSAEYFENSGNPNWAKAVIRYGKKLDKADRAYEEALQRERERRAWLNSDIVFSEPFIPVLGPSCFRRVEHIEG